jgi:hypothetical protein
VSAKRKAKDRSQRLDLRAGKELLLLWAILGEGGGSDVSRSALNDKGMLPSDDKAARDGLEAKGLIKAEKRTSRSETGRSISGYWMSVTETGRTWAEDNLAAVPAKSQAAAPILQAWLRRLSIFLHARNISMTEFLERHHAENREPGTELAIAPVVPSHTRPSPLALDYDALRARVRQAYLELTGGRLNTRALLSDLRKRLNDIDRRSLDETLGRMHLEEGTTLSGLNNPQEITPAIRDGGLTFKGEPITFFGSPNERGSPSAPSRRPQLDP